MDCWIVGAAAAAGYVAKYWQNVSKDRDSLSESGPSKHEKNEDPSCPIRRRLSGRKKLVEDTSTKYRCLDAYKLDGASEAEVSSSSYVEHLGSLANSDDSNILSLSCLPVGFSTNEILKENHGGNGLTTDVGNNSARSCTGEVDFSHDSTEKRSSLKTKYGHFIKPLSSLESCLLAQLYTEHSKMEDYMLRVLPSPSTTMRTLIVTDGNQIISRANGDYFSAQIGTDVRLHKKENVSGVPPLPKVSTLDAPNKIKSKIVKGYIERFSKAGSGRHFLSQKGSLDQTFLFCLGISVGIVSSLLSNSREIDKLKDLLKQTENLVQDLQEELEMKDSLTVKELADEKCESQDTCEIPSPLLLEQNGDNSTNYDGKESQYEKPEETSGEMSKIEAELEAELERLGLKINTSNLEGRLSDLVEIDPDFVADFAQGELRADMMVNGQAVAQVESDRDASGTSTTPTGNYAVSPKELSLRLHEVIQSRLEERVEELEVALQNSERRLQVMESEQKNVRRKLSSSKLRYSSGEESLTSEEDLNSMAQPLVMNLSGDALDAYNEAYEVLMKANESEEDDSPPGVYKNSFQGGTHPFNQSLLWGQHGAANGSSTHLIHAKEKPSTELYNNQLKQSEDRGQGVQKLLYDGISEDENSDCSDEMEKQLIRQIVERTRKGSPVVLNAQRVLFCMDEIEH